MTLTDLRQLYLGRGVALKQPQPKLGGPKPKSAEAQANEIRKLQDEVNSWQAAGYSIVCCDEVTFSLRGKSEKIWMQKHDPIQVRMAVRNVPFTAVVGFASVEHGLIHWSMQQQQAFDRHTFIEAVLELQEQPALKK